jgi:transcriptional regulator with XRE-family HTH domain
MTKAKGNGWPPTGFGARLKALREAAGLSQPQLAERAGCNKFTVAKMEQGRQEPAWPLVLALAGALGVEVGAFVPVAGAPAAQDAPTPRGRGRPASPPPRAPARQPARGKGRQKGK